MPELQDLESLQELGNPQRAVMRALTVTRDKDPSGHPTNIIRLSYRGPLANECAIILDAIVRSYEEFVKETDQALGKELAGLVNDAMNLLHKDLVQAESAYQEFRAKHPLVPKNKDEIQASHNIMGGVEQELVALQMREAEVSGRLRAIRTAVKEGRDPTPFLEMASPSLKPSVSDVRQTPSSAAESSLMTLLLQERELAQTYGPDHPQLKAVRSCLEVARSFGSRNESGAAAKEAVEKQIQRLELQLADLKHTATGVQTILAKERQETLQRAEYSQQEEKHQRQLTVVQELLNTIRKRVQDVDITKNYVGFMTQIVQPPESAPAGPKIWTVVGLAAFSGLLIGMALAWLGEVTDNRIRSPEDVRRRLGLPVIGHIPHLGSGCVVQRETGGVIAAPVLCTLHRPRSREAEAYRGVRTALYFSNHGEGAKVYQITSAERQAGKTLLAANLAGSVAQSGKRVLLIDGDLRRPSVHRLFGLSAAQGLATVLTGQAEVQEVLQASGVEGLTILPCGPRPHNPAELLTSPRFAELLNQLRERFDCIIIDTPATLVVSDPAVVAPRVDGVLLVIRESHSGWPQAQRAQGLLDTVGANVVGVIVNDISRPGKSKVATGTYGDDGKSARDRNYFEETGPEPVTTSGRRSDPIISIERANGQNGNPTGP
jgi:capsular exopolysaccharide synthesis family protein